MKTFKISCRKVKYQFHPTVEIFSFQHEVKGPCMSKKNHPLVYFTSPTCNMPLQDTLRKGKGRLLSSEDLFFLYWDFRCLSSFYALVMTLFEDIMLYALVIFNYFML